MVLKEMNVNSLLNPRLDDATSSKANCIIDRPIQLPPPSSSRARSRWDCNQIRTKINALLRSGEYKVTHFQRELGINSNSYGRFMRLRGPAGGCDNQTYHRALDFFLERERRGVKAPRAPRPRAEDLKKFDVDDIHLPGEETDRVPVFDTCDDLRPKIQAHLRQPGVTQAAFLRAVGRQYAEPRGVQSAQLQRFLQQHGPTAGAANAVYYGAYCYFEKLRLKRGAPKTQKRLDVEARRAGGMPRDARPQRVWCGPGEAPYEDDFGFVGREAVGP